MKKSTPPLRKSGAALIALTTSALVLAGCSSESTTDSGSTAAAGATETTMMLPFPRGIFWTPLVVAQEQGYFDDQGIALQVEEAAGSGFVTQQLIAGNVDIGWAGAASAVVAAENDPNIRIVMCYPSNNIFRIVTPEGSGIGSIADLRERTLGITEAGGGEEPIVNAALTEAGLQPNNNVTLLPVGDAGPQSLTALQNGTIDAYATSFADLATFTATGTALTDITPASLEPIPGDCMLTTAAVLADEQRRDTLLRASRAWVMGAAFTEANPAAALSIVCASIPEECTDMDYAQVYFDEVMLYSGGYQPDAPYGVVDASGWRTTVDVLAASGVIDGTLDPAVTATGDDVVELQQDYSDIDTAAVEQDAQQYAP